MNNIYGVVMIDVKISDPTALWQTAYDTYGGTVENFEELCGKKDNPEISSCLIMIFDPGQSPKGCEIENTGCEVYDV